MFETTFKDLAKEVHGTKYCYDKTVYISANEKVIITCLQHGDFLQTPSKHVNMKRGCQLCGGTAKLTIETFLEKLRARDDPFSERLDYSLVTTIENNKTPVKIICKLHGEFEMTPDKHLRGHGCRKCKSNASMLAIAWLEYTAEQHSVTIQHALKGGEKMVSIDGKTYMVDGYCEATNTIYQFHGDYFHGNPEVYANTQKKHKARCNVW